MSRSLILFDFRRWTTFYWLALAALVGPAAAQAQPQAEVPAQASAQEASDDAVYRRFDEISAMRADGEFDRAIAVLNEIIEDHAGSSEVLRRAYNESVFTILSKRSIASDEAARSALNEEARARAEEALRRFPDLVADRHYFPVEINTIYDDLRQTMFGEVHIVTDPSGCRVQVGDAFDGTSPVSIAYLPVGSYRLVVSREDYKDRTDSLTVIPGGVVQREVSLSKKGHSNKWWIVPSLAASALIAISIAGGDDGGGDDETTALPGPPPPPAR
jgi:hypothetical protein